MQIFESILRINTKMSFLSHVGYATEGSVLFVQHTEYFGILPYVTRNPICSSP